MRVLRKVSFSVVLLLLFMGSVARAHEERAPVIVDTDMAMDDVRALLLLLFSPRVEVKAIVTSDGASSPEIGCENVRRLLSFLGREDIPVAAGAKSEVPPPPWREMSEALGWAKLPKAKDGRPGPCATGQPPPPTSTGPGAEHLSGAASLIRKTLAESDRAVGYVCIGPMTNLAEFLRLDPSAGSRVSSIFYYGSSPEDPRPDWNTTRDVEAAKAVFASGATIYSMRLKENELLTFNRPLLGEIRKTGSPAARLLSLLYRDGRVKQLLGRNHFKAWDETVALCLDDPHLGKFEKASADRPLYRLSGWNKAAARVDYIRIFLHAANRRLDSRIPVVLRAFPSNPSDFQDYLRPFVSRIIAVNGVEEWKAVVLTNELHRHLGIYSILGAKMGILAREILDASLDDLAVETRAGAKPPLSCLNDGLQVATGASLGRGTITVEDNGGPAAEAIFIKGDRKLRLRLKKSVEERVGTDLQGAARRYGDLTPAYFKEVKRLAVEYWLNMKRDEIFDREFL